MIRPHLAVAFVSLWLTACSGTPPPIACGAGTHLAGTLCEAELLDAGFVDAGLPDAGPVDAGPMDAGVPDAGPLLPLESEPSCARMRGGPSNSSHVAVAFSEAHAAVRHFGPFEQYPAVDTVLSTALNGKDLLSQQGVVIYAAALIDVCALRADDRALPQASVQLSGDVAIVRPGAGGVTIPSGARAIAIDLRGLPGAAGLELALREAGSASLPSSLALSRQVVRKFYGYPDEYTAMNAYENEMVTLPGGTLPGRLTAGLPLAVITEEAMAPETARFAGELRLRNQAWLWGTGVLAATGESRWQAIGQVGVGYRAMNLLDALGRWPDVIRADVDTAGIPGALAALSTMSAPPGQTRQIAMRSELKAINPMAGAAMKGLTLGSARAAQLIAHGILRKFFPYFHVVGDTIDARLAETIAALDAPGVTLTRTLHLNLLSRLGEAVHDGHNFIGDVSGETPLAGYLPVLLTDVAAEPVVTTSLTPMINKGDTLVSIGGRPMSDWMAEQLPRTAGASPGYRFDLATRRLVELSGPTAIGLRAPDQALRTVTVTPVTPAQYFSLFDLNQRRAGFLTQRGAPTVYYVSLDVPADVTDGCVKVLNEASTAAGLIVDMRGYPVEGAFDCMSRLAQTRMLSPIFRIPVLTGPTLSSVDESQGWFLDPVSNPNFAGKMVLLVGTTTVSAAETISAMLVDAKRTKKVVGRPSAATNGNITYARLPGALYFSFTGMEVLRLDRGVFHGKGIVPDIEVLPTVADLASGTDRTLDTAITAVLAP